MIEAAPGITVPFAEAFAAETFAIGLAEAFAVEPVLPSPEPPPPHALRR
jgi:hypothetical protein